MNEREITRAKILGVLIQDARLHADRSIEDCAQVAGISADDFVRAERGEYVISLPELEVLAMYLGVPMAHFWGSETLDEVEKPDYETFLTLRRRIVGGLLRQARLDAGFSVAELAAEVDVEAERLQAYEMGKAMIPILELERIGKRLGVLLDHFLDEERGPLARHEAEQKMKRNLEELPPDVKEFVANPVNINYLKTSMRLSEMDVDKLRDIAAGLLDITF